MSYEQLLKNVDPEDLKYARQLAFVTALKTISDESDSPDEFVSFISNRVNAVYRYMDEVQWEIVYTMETGDDMPIYMAKFLGLETNDI